MRIALIQMNVTDDKKINVFHAGEKIREAAEKGVDIAVLPEMFCCPYTNENFKRNAEPYNGYIWNYIYNLAKKNNIDILKPMSINLKKSS